MSAPLDVETSEPTQVVLPKVKEDDSNVDSHLLAQVGVDEPEMVHMLTQPPSGGSAVGVISHGAGSPTLVGDRRADAVSHGGADLLDTSQGSGGGGGGGDGGFTQPRSDYW